jgi:UDP-glucuronate 4-epimerase
MARILLTGIAGFIGMHVTGRLLADGHSVIGVDNLNDYYRVDLKLARLRELERQGELEFVRLDIGDHANLWRTFERFAPTRVVHLAAQAGVRYSLTNPHAYVDSNLSGFLNILECSRRARVEHLIYASSSSVYGSNSKLPFSTSDATDHPLSLYAATKKSNELMAHAYSHLFRLPTTGLRFFTVYGPWGRPDMAPSLFASAIMQGQPIEVFNGGHMKRDFTYVEDVAEVVTRIADVIPAPDPEWSSAAPRISTSDAPFRLYNVGHGRPVDLSRFIELLEFHLGRPAIREMKPMQPGDVLETWADTTELESVIGFAPRTTLDEGVPRFAEWFKAWTREAQDTEPNRVQGDGCRADG